MHPEDFTRICDSLARNDRVEAMGILRSAIEANRIEARDGIELMLALRKNSLAEMMEAIDTVKQGLPGAYRFMPNADYAFA